MKKYEHLFENDTDKILFITLFRSMKDIGYKPRLKKGEIIDKCYKSRHDHERELLFTNASFWPKDIYEERADVHSYAALFIARIINMDLLDSGLFQESLFYNFMDYINAFNFYLTPYTEEIVLSLKKVEKLNNTFFRRADLHTVILKIRELDISEKIDFNKETTPYQI